MNNYFSSLWHHMTSCLQHRSHTVEQPQATRDGGGVQTENQRPLTSRSIVQQNPYNRRQLQLEILSHSPLDPLSHFLYKVEYMSSHAPHWVRPSLDIPATRDMLRIREQLNSGIAREVHAAHEVMYRASVVEQCLARKRYLSQHGSQSDIEEINTQLNLAQEALDQARSKYRQNVERNIVARPVLERMVRYITHSLYEEGILSLEAFVALHVVPNNGERPSRALLPSYSQVEHAKRIERQSYYRTEQVPAIRTTHSSPPPYEEAITSPPAYTIHEMTRL